jgi:hypothetical protein
MDGFQVCEVGRKGHPHPFSVRHARSTKFTVEGSQRYGRMTGFSMSETASRMAPHSECVPTSFSFKGLKDKNVHVIDAFVGKKYQRRKI